MFERHVREKPHIFKAYCEGYNNVFQMLLPKYPSSFIVDHKLALKQSDKDLT